MYHLEQCTCNLAFFPITLFFFLNQRSTWRFAGKLFVSWALSSNEQKQFSRHVASFGSMVHAQSSLVASRLARRSVFSQVNILLAWFLLTENWRNRVFITDSVSKTVRHTSRHFLVNTFSCTTSYNALISSLVCIILLKTLHSQYSKIAIPI